MLSTGKLLLLAFWRKLVNKWAVTARSDWMSKFSTEFHIMLFFFLSLNSWSWRVDVWTKWQLISTEFVWVVLVASSTLHSFSRCGMVHSHRDWAHKTRSVPREACVMAALTTPGLCKQHSVDSRVRPFHHVPTLLTFRPETGVQRDGGRPVKPLILENDWIYISLKLWVL